MVALPGLASVGCITGQGHTNYHPPSPGSGLQAVKSRTWQGSTADNATATVINPATGEFIHFDSGINSRGQKHAFDYLGTRDALRSLTELGKSADNLARGKSRDATKVATGNTKAGTRAKEIEAGIRQAEIGAETTRPLAR